MLCFKDFVRLFCKVIDQYRRRHRHHRRRNHIHRPLVLVLVLVYLGSPTEYVVALVESIRVEEMVVVSCEWHFLPPLIQ